MVLINGYLTRVLIGSFLIIDTERKIDTYNTCIFLLFQIEKIKNIGRVKRVEKDRRTKLMTSYTPQFLGLPTVWTQQGGDRNAGDGIVIGFVDSGINPIHPSFAYDPTNPFTKNISTFSGACENGPFFPEASCNGKIVSARFFASGAKAANITLNASDYLSPFDAVGHGR